MFLNNIKRGIQTKSCLDGTVTHRYSQKIPWKRLTPVTPDLHKYYYLVVVCIGLSELYSYKPVPCWETIEDKKHPSITYIINFVCSVAVFVLGIPPYVGTLMYQVEITCSSPNSIIT